MADTSNRASNRLIVIDEEEKTLKEWAEYATELHQCKISYQMIQKRIDVLGWDPDLAIHAKPRHYIKYYGKAKKADRPPSAPQTYKRLGHQSEH